CAVLSFVVTKPGNVARLQRGKVTLAFRLTEKFAEVFHDGLVTVVRRLLRFDCFGFQPRFAPRFDGRARHRFDIGGSENVAYALRDHFARGVHAQLAIARFQRGLVPCAAYFERLLPVARFRGAKDAPARAGFGVEDRKCAEPVRSAWLTMNAWHSGITLMHNIHPCPETFLDVHLRW